MDVRSVGSQLAGLSRAALQTFAGTLLAVTLVEAVLAALSYAALREHHWAYGTAAAATALVESVAVGFALGVKRAVVTAVADALGRLRLGRELVGRVFGRMLGVAEGAEFGERGGHLARGLERLPLARAEELLMRAVRAVAGEEGRGNWLRRKVRARLLEAVRAYTLARFREEGAAHGGVDLLKVKEELERTVDDALVRKVRGGLRLWTVLVAVGLPAVVAAQTWAAAALLRPGE